MIVEKLVDSQRSMDANREKIIIRREAAYERSILLLFCGQILVLAGLLLEALFQVSKISYLSQLTVLETLPVLINSLALLSVPVVLVWAVFFLSSLLLNHKHYALISWVSLLLLSFALVAISFFSYLEPFFYTVFRKDVYDLPFPTGIIILFVLVDVAVVLAIKKGKAFIDFCFKHKRKFWIAALSMWVISCLCVGMTLYLRGLRLRGVLANINRTRNRPNIILFSPDGFDRRHMGIYGYQQNTTPNLDKIDNAIIYRRAYCNSGSSRGSVISFLTGKSPAITKVIYPPDILHGKDAFQHLPNILLRLGYYNIDLNDGLYASTRHSNLRRGFHLENGVEMDPLFWENTLSSKLRIIFSDEAYFLSDVLTKYKDKLLYLAGIFRTAPFSNFSYARFVAEGEGTNLTDEKRVEIATRAIREINTPLFIHLHLMGTHSYAVMGGKHECTGEGSAFSEPYDNLVFSMDRYFGEVLDALRDSAKIDNTIIIFQTDHGPTRHYGESYNVIKFPLPLIVSLPGKRERTVIDEPVQYLDIAPSILRFLEQPIPDWMRGRVIFGGSPEDSQVGAHPILSVATTQDVLAGKILFHREFGPPYFGIHFFVLFAEDKCYIHSTESESGKLYDLSGNPYDFRPVQSPELTQKYHVMLVSELKQTGISLRSVGVAGEEKFPGD